MRESWTDERLDDLNVRIGEGFGRIDADLRAQRTESIALRREMKEGFDALGAEMNARFDAMHQTMIRFAGIAIATLLGVIATQL